jgi:hypothetical protein
VLKSYYPLFREIAIESQNVRSQELSNGYFYCPFADRKINFSIRYFDALQVTLVQKLNTLVCLAYPVLFKQLVTCLSAFLNTKINIKHRLSKPCFPNGSICFPNGKILLPNERRVVFFKLSTETLKMIAFSGLRHALLAAQRAEQQLQEELYFAYGQKKARF